MFEVHPILNMRIDDEYDVPYMVGNSKPDVIVESDVGDDFILDFKQVVFVNMNFAQAYYNAKNESPKRISEINISDEISVVMGAADEACNP